MLFLHANLEKVSKLCVDATRYGMTGVCVKALPDGHSYRVEATDGRRLVRVDGGNVANADTYPACTAFANATDTALSGTIPAKEFARACHDAPKNGPRADLRCVAVKLATNEATMQTTDGESALVRQAHLIDGRFPDTDLVFPKTEALGKLTINGFLLEELLEVLGSLVGRSERCSVTMEFRPKGAPLVLRLTTAEQSAVALLMPLNE